MSNTLINMGSWDKSGNRVQDYYVVDTNKVKDKKLLTFLEKGVKQFKEIDQDTPIAERPAVCLVDNEFLVASYVERNFKECEVRFPCTVDAVLTIMEPTFRVNGKPATC